MRRSPGGRRIESCVTPAMTSHFLDRIRMHDQNRQNQHQENDCLFCLIVARKQSAFIVAETNEYMAFLDTLPIRTGMFHVVT